MTKDIDLIEATRKRPHLFILGAGATKATIPNGDRNRLASPVMENFLNEIGLDKILQDVILETKSKNIEAIYGELASRPECKQITLKIEERIVNHYSKMMIPLSPTLYDYLILSLRKKDCIATFNWDPLLIQAYNRVNKITDDLPELLFLHGCVAVGICDHCGIYAPLQNQRCSKCGRTLIMPKLLYPVGSKDYNQNIFIKHSWNELKYYIERACVLTIWGYSAPDSDVEAKQIMLEAFSKNFKKLDSIEIIDKAGENIILEKWNTFIKETNYHAKIYKSLFDSLIGEFPRRSIEGYTKRYIEGWWGKSNHIMKQCQTLDELKKDYTILLSDESNNKFNVI